MTISLHADVMTADEKPESSHEYNFFLDRQLQNKLLDFDEQDIDSRYFQNVKLDGKSYKAQVRNEEVTGWIYDPKNNFRKPEKENSKQQKEFIQPWKDYKARQQKDDSFMFRHYGDLKKYIQQYRQEHSYANGFRPPGMTKSDVPIGELRKYLHHHSAPTPSAGAIQNQISTQSQSSTQTQVSTVCTQCTNTNGSNQQLITASMYYTNRKDSLVSLPNGASVSNPRTSSNHSHGHQCSKHNHVHINPDHAYKYKLAPDAAWRSDSVQSSCVESDRNEGVRTPRINSAKGDRGKSPTKVMVPAGASNGPQKGHPLQTVTVAWRLPSQARQSGADNHVQTNSTSRTLDTLACVAAEKQGYICEYPMTPDVSFSPDNMDNKSDISLSRLSTTCLGAEMKVRLNETLEPSCTFHLFPSESVLEGPPIILKTAKPILWNPSTSSPVHRKDSRRETMVSSPFRGYVKVINPNVDYKPKMKLILNKEDAGKVDFPVIKSKNGMLVAADINLSDQAKFKEEAMQQKSHEGTVLPEKKSSSASYEKTSKLFCTKNLRSRFAGYIKGKKTRASALRKSENAANNRNAYSARVVRSDRSDLPNSLRGESVSPGLNYWTEEPEEYTNETKPGNAVSISTIESSESMKRVAEYILRENSSVGINATSQEMWFDSAGRAYVSLAARYDPLKK
ncbi:uncharacterized protein LOC110447298 isoform X3 [Mizuhopecten yessoensis]|uniref:uncharacterized protein LOC110447298 isoform X3 n=1 Tax=Mizuhopecten yessoensis TaxID=6573 RepID=UPI000B458172|nr:uncharacterized protein LOC110447298 isoform X3 [Mizuhopecten yessoensis]